MVAGRASPSLHCAGHERLPLIESMTIEAYSAGASSHMKCPASMMASRLVGKPLVEKLSVGERNNGIVAAVDDRHRRRDLRQQLGKLGQLLGIPADVAHRFGEAVPVVAVQVVGADVVRYPARDSVHGRADDRARVHLAVFVEVGVEHPRRQWLTELQRNRSSARAHDHAREPLRMRRRRKQGGRGPDIRRDDVRRAQISLGDQLGQEPAHRSRRQEILSAFGCAEARQVDGEQAGVVGKRGPDRREREHALGPGTRQQDHRLLRATAVGVADPDSVNRPKLGLYPMGLRHPEIRSNDGLTRTARRCA